MKKLLIAVALTVTSLTVHAFSPTVIPATSTVKLDAEGCDHYSHIVAAAQRLRNLGGSLSQAQDNFSNLAGSPNPKFREVARSINEYAEYIWSQPRNNWTEQKALRIAENFCFAHLSK